METRPQKPSSTTKQSPENFVRDMRRNTPKRYSLEQKILIVMEALRGEDSVAAICKKHGTRESMFYKWNGSVSGSGQEAAGRRYHQRSHFRGSSGPQKRTSKA